MTKIKYNEVKELMKNLSIQINGVAVNVPSSYHYNRLQLITYWNEYKFVSPNGELLSRGPRPHTNQEREIPQFSIVTNWRINQKSVVCQGAFRIFRDGKHCLLIKH